MECAHECGGSRDGGAFCLVGLGGGHGSGQRVAASFTFADSGSFARAGFCFWTGAAISPAAAENELSRARIGADAFSGARGAAPAAQHDRAALSPDGAGI